MLNNKHKQRVQYLNPVRRVWLANLRTGFQELGGSGVSVQTQLNALPYPTCSESNVRTVELLINLFQITSVSTRRPLHLNKVSCNSLTKDEIALLNTVEFARDDDTENGLMALNWLFVGGAQKLAVFNHLRELASLSEPADLTHTGSFNGAFKLHPQIGEFNNLAISEATFITAMRMWVENHNSGTHITDTIESPIAGEEAQAAAECVCEILEVIAKFTLRPVEIRCLCCGEHVSPDEARLLDALASTQFGMDDLSRFVLSDMLPQAAIRMMSDALSHLAIIYESSGLFLPLRAWNFDQLAGAADNLPHSSAEYQH